MKVKHITIFIVALLVVDQLLKIWIKTDFKLGEALIVFPDWFQLRFIENNGAAFGMQISSAGAFDWGKMLLSLFRVVMIGALCVYLYRQAKQGASKMLVIPLAMIVAGAIGNMIDSAFYGLIFSESTPSAVAHVGDGYAPFMMGRVVDMFYFPLFKWDGVPDALSFLVDSNNYFFGAIFNLADSYISVGVVLFLIYSIKLEQDKKRSESTK